MARETILVVEDEEDILEILSYNLIRNGFQVSAATTGEEGLSMARSILPNLIILDWMLPEMDGITVCKELKSASKTKDIPVVMLTAKSEETDIIQGLETGADDYMTKPFTPKILIAKIKNILKRHSEQTSSPTQGAIHIHDLAIHPGRHEASIAGQPIDLTFTEFQILHFLVQRPGWVFSRDQIVEAVHGEGYSVTDRSIDVQVVGLRKKLGESGQYIETVRGIGYRFKE